MQRGSRLLSKKLGPPKEFGPPCLRVSHKHLRDGGSTALPIGGAPNVEGGWSN